MKKTFLITLLFAVLAQAQFAPVQITGKIRSFDKKIVVIDNGGQFPLSVPRVLFDSGKKLMAGDQASVKVDFFTLKLLNSAAMHTALKENKAVNE